MKKAILIYLLTTLFQLHGQAFTLSKQAEISILTCSPGQELYSLFGHTAIRVFDPTNRYDEVFNYGTFDFSTPYFYLKYARGLLPYQLTHTHFNNFMYSYQLEERSVYSQRLLLDSIQKQTLFNLLLENYRPENRSYLYNFLYDNCTTRSRDILLKSLPEKVTWNLPDQNKNFWNLLDEYLKASPWVQWGIHSILGQGGNQTANTFQYMFLPDYLMFGLDLATIDSKRLAENRVTLYQAPEHSNYSPWYTSPLSVFAFASLAIMLLIYKAKNRILLNSFTVIMFLFTGLLGCLIVFLGAFTAHPITAPNWNILWANPLNIVALFFILRSSIPYFAQIYLKIYMALLTISLPVYIIGQPALPFASVFLTILMLFLCLQLRKYKQT